MLTWHKQTPVAFARQKWLKALRAKCSLKMLFEWGLHKVRWYHTNIAYWALSLTATHQMVLRLFAFKLYGISMHAAIFRLTKEVLKALHFDRRGYFPSIKFLDDTFLFQPISRFRCEEWFHWVYILKIRTSCVFLFLTRIAQIQEFCCCRWNKCMSQAVLFIVKLLPSPRLQESVILE